MPRSSLLSRAVTQIVDGQPKSCHHFVNTSIPAVSGGKRARNGKNDESRRPLVGYTDSEVYEQQGKDYEIMGSEETTHLFCGKSFYEAIRINESKGRQKDTESINDDLRYSTVDPVWMNVRLCIFWFLWATLIVVIIGSILSYCCLLPQTCTNTEKVPNLNATPAVTAK